MGTCDAALQKKRKGGEGEGVRKQNISRFTTLLCANGCQFRCVSSTTRKKKREGGRGGREGAPRARPPRFFSKKKRKGRGGRRNLSVQNYFSPLQISICTEKRGGKMGGGNKEGREAASGIPLHGNLEIVNYTIEKKKGGGKKKREKIMT